MSSTFSREDDELTDRRLIAGRSRRNALLQAGARLFSERGYLATSINDIGEAADVSGPAIYRHFANKEELLVETVLRLSRLLETRLRAVQGKSIDDPVERLEQMVYAILSTVTDHPSETAVYLREARYLSQDHQERLRDADSYHRSQITAALQCARPELTEDQARSLSNMAMNTIAGFVVEAPLSNLIPEEIPFALRALLTLLMQTPAGVKP